MEPQKAAAEDGKAFEATRVEVLPGYAIASGYRIELLNPSQMTETGLLKVFEVLSNAGAPSFIGRWDQKRNQLDVDIEGVSASTKRKFKASRAGYQGHKTRKVPSSKGWEFSVAIGTPTEEVFAGRISINFLRKLELGLRATAAVQVEADVVPSDRAAREVGGGAGREDSES